MKRLTAQALRCGGVQQKQVGDTKIELYFEHVYHVRRFTKKENGESLRTDWSSFEALNKANTFFGRLVRETKREMKGWEI